MDLGVSFGVSISINLLDPIQSEEIFHVAKGNVTGVAGVRSNTMPIGE